VLDPFVSRHIIMQAPPPPTNQAEAEDVIPMEIASNDATMNRAVNVHRKAAKRTLPWDLEAEELLLLSSPPPQAEDIQTARKKQRLEEPLPETTDEAARKTASPDISVGLPSPAAADDDANTNADPSMDTQPNAGETRVTGSWTSEEDGKLTRAVANTSKKKYGKEYKTDWVAIAALVPGRTNKQCWGRWTVVLDPSISPASGRKGEWTADEDRHLKPYPRRV
jgi:hypothetical protein